MQDTRKPCQPGVQLKVLEAAARTYLQHQVHDNNANCVREAVRNQDTKAPQKKRIKIQNTAAAEGQLCSNIPTLLHKEQLKFITNHSRSVKPRWLKNSGLKNCCQLQRNEKRLSLSEYYSKGNIQDYFHFFVYQVLNFSCLSNYLWRIWKLAAELSCLSKST